MALICKTCTELCHSWPLGLTCLPSHEKQPETDRLLTLAVETEEVEVDDTAVAAAVACSGSGASAVVAEAGSGRTSSGSRAFGIRNRACYFAFRRKPYQSLVTRFGCEEFVQARHLSNHLEAGHKGLTTLYT